VLKVPDVLTGMSTQLTIQDAMAHFSVSERTIRRWIKQGKVNAEKRDGRYYIDIPMSDALPSDQASDQATLIEQLRRENEHLKSQLTTKDEQIDHLQQLLAIQTKTNASLTERITAIEDMRSRSWFKRLFRRV